MRDFTTDDIAIISIAGLAGLSMFLYFDTALVSGAIAAITAVLGVGRYLGRQAQASTTGSPL